MQGMNLEKELDITPDQALFSWLEEDEVVFTNKALMTRILQVQSNYNTR